jgi:hypothetical protein
MCNPNDIEIPDAPKNIYSYLLRDIDIEIAESDEKCFIYAKFARFIFIGAIEGLENSSFIKTDISLNTNIQSINDSDVVNFIINRAKKHQSFEDLSKEQKEKNNQYFEKRIDQIRGNDYWNQFLKDNK